MTSYSLTILLISILFCTVSTVLTIMLKRANSKQEKLLAEMRATLEARQNNTETQEEQKENYPAANIFDDNLRTAELTTRLQHPRLTMQQCGSSPATPERYHYIQSMVEKGMNAQEIASMLSMSLHETTQIVTLIKMVRQPQSWNEERLSAQEIADNQEIRSAKLAQPGKQPVHKQIPAPQLSGTVNRSIKLARWLKGRALAPYLRRQSSREPPPHPLPRDHGIPYQPVPTGYT
jgi:hypothetical protein